MGKNIIITGASSDIGIAISKELLKKDNKLILTYYEHKEILDDFKKKYSKYDIDIYKLDLTDKESIANLVNKVLEKYHHIDILVNNAAYTYDCLMSCKEKEKMLRTFDVNVVGTFLLTRSIALNMQEYKQGKIINIASDNGLGLGYEESIDYDASKAGLINLTFNLARAYSPYINVNVICPGWVDTKINKDLEENFKNEQLDKILLKRFGSPKEIAHVVSFLTSDNSSYINGSIIRVDGGRK